MTNYFMKLQQLLLHKFVIKNIIGNLKKQYNGKISIVGQA